MSDDVNGLDEKLRRKLRQLADARRRLGKLRDEVDARREEWREQHAQLLADAEDAKDEVRALDDQVRSLAVQAFRKRGDKHPADGVDVKEHRELKYDPDDAEAWAREHDMCMAFDQRAFEKVAKADLSAFDFVAEVTKPKAYIASNLEGDDGR